MRVGLRSLGAANPRIHLTEADYVRMAAAAGLCPAGGQPPRRIGAAEFAAMIREELREHIDRKVGAAIDSSPQHGTEWAMLIGLRALTMLGGNSDNVPAPAVAAPPPPGVVAAAAAVGGPLEPLVDFVADSGDSVRARASQRPYPRRHLWISSF